MFIIFSPRIIKGKNTKAQNHRITNFTFRAKASSRGVKFCYIVSVSERSCFCVLLTALQTLAKLVRDIINTSDSFTMIRFTTRPHVSLPPFKTSCSKFIDLLAHIVGFDRQQLGFQIQFCLVKARTCKKAATFKILTKSCLYYKVTYFIFYT